MKDTLVPVVNSEYTVEKFDDEILLYSESGTSAIYLNDTAHVVWLLCKENMNVMAMVNYLKQQFPDQKEKIREDVITALNTLHLNGVVEFFDEK